MLDKTAQSCYARNGTKEIYARRRKVAGIFVGDFVARHCRSIVFHC